MGVGVAVAVAAAASAAVVVRRVSSRVRDRPLFA